jgi:hypothetical protein
MDTPHPNEVVKYCQQCRCKTWTDVDGNCEWSDMHHPATVEKLDNLQFGRVLHHRPSK